MQEAQDQKKILRQEMLVRRREVNAGNPDAPEVLRDVFLVKVKLPPAPRISFYLAQKDEMDCWPLAQALADRGHELCLPVVVGKDVPLAFRAYRFGDPLEEGAWRIPQPLASSPLVVPTVLLVPLLAFDKGGNRLGYGGGFYDRTLAALRKKQPVLAIGLAFAAQEVSFVPVDSGDMKLDAFVTEKGLRGQERDKNYMLP